MFSTPVDEIERMVAVKKAYAEMILNTSQEAAARVMAAERKAQKFEQDLLSVKEEAVRMLLRMKQMVDSKNREAEITSLNEKRRINELEAQLDEAEGVIVDLRAELSLVQDQLDDMKSKYMHSLRQAEKVVIHSQDKIFDSEQSHFAPFKSFSEPECKTSEVLALTSEHSILGPESFLSAKENATPNPILNHHPVHEPLAPVMSKSKEPEFFRNRCTQRIREFETELVDVKLNSTDEIISQLENKSTIRKEKQNKVINSMSIHRTDKFNELDISIKQAAFHEDNPAHDQPVKLHKVCRRRTHYRRTKAASCKYKSGHVVKPRRTSFATSHCKSHSHASNHVHRPGCVSTNARNISEADYACALEAKGHIAKGHTVSVMRRSVRKRKIKNWDGFATSCKLNVSHSRQYDEPCQTDKCNEKFCKDLLEVEHGGKPEEASTIITTHMNSVRGSTSLGDSVEKDRRVTNVSTMPDKQDELASDLELEGASWILSDTKDIKMSTMTNEASSQPDSNVPLKYTFFRKRKTPLTDFVEINSLQEKPTKKRSGEETDKVLAPDGSGYCVHASSRDGRRLVQVAHQLISLSGKRW